jgi:protease-4
MSAPPSNGKSKSRTGLWIVIVLLALVLCASVLVNFGLLLVSSLSAPSFRMARGGVDEFPELMEQWSYGQGDVKAVRIPLEGVIMRNAGGSLIGPPVDRIQQIMRQIRAATADREVRAIVLEVDSPGGAITPSDELYNELVRFKTSRSDRIVTVHMRGLAASGGYYVAMGADWIVAEPTTIVGSIGVIIQSLNWKELADKAGVRSITIKSGDNKDMLNPFGEETEEQVALLQNLIDSMHDRFTDIVHEARGIDRATLEELADGRIFTAEQALDSDLIDEIGYWDDAARRTAELLGEDSVKFVRYQHPGGLMTLLTGVRFPVSTASLLDAALPRPMYLWHP